MADHFNRLTPAEAELLALLAEECAEVIAVVGKILRHGYESWHPDGDRDLTNRRLLQLELGDVRCAQDMLEAAGAVNAAAILLRSMDKRAKVQQYLHHAREVRHA